MRTPTACLLVASLSLLAGCAGYYAPGGDGRSRDTFTYVSTSHMPQTITLVDTRTGESLWTTDVPVGQQLVVRFRNLKEGEAEGTDEMRWALMPAGTRNGRLTNSVQVPSAPYRRLDGTLREGPELVTAARPPSRSLAPASSQPQNQPQYQPPRTLPAPAAASPAAPAPEAPTGATPTAQPAPAGPTPGHPEPIDPRPADLRPPAEPAPTPPAKPPVDLPEKE